MKRLNIIMLVLMLLISLTACSKSENQVNNTNSEGLTAEEILGINQSQDENNTNNTDNTEEQDLSTITGTEDINTSDDNQNTDLNQNINSDNQNKELDQNNDNKLNSDNILSSLYEIRVIDCGQADSILIHSSDTNILVDAGEETNAAAIRKVLDNKGVKKIDLLVATHPHADHIGGMKAIVDNYDIDKVIMSPQIHTTKTYEELLVSIDSKDKSITIAEPGKSYNIGDIKFDVIGPCKDYDDDLNNNSVVAVASYGDIDILLTGDAELQAEKDYTKYLINRDIEILKVGHHGSDTSTSENLLEIVKPEIAVISCGEGNKYGHPKQETLDKLYKFGVNVYRTDLTGDIIIRTDGNSYTVEDEDGNELSISDIDNSKIEENNNNNDTSKDNNNTNNQNSWSSNIVYTSKSGKKYHSTENCVALYVSREKKSMTEQEAISNGLTRCSKCWE